MSDANAAIVAYHDALERRRSHAAEMMNWLLAEESKRRLSYGGKPIPTLLRPAFIAAVDAQMVARVVAVLAEALEQVLRDYRDHPEVRRAIPFEAGTEDLLAMPTGLSRNVIVARYDAFLKDGELRFNEFNTDSPASMGWNQEQQALFRQLPMMAEVEERFLVESPQSGDALVDALLAAYADAGLAEPPRVIITDWNEVSTREEFEVNREHLARRGIASAIADPRELEMRDGLVCHEGFCANLVYRRVVWSELLEKLDECGGLLGALRSDRVCVANPLAAKIAGNKACLAYLTDPANGHRFTETQRAAIAAHIPRTMVLRHGKVDYHGRMVDPFDLATEAPGGFVVKPLNLYGGQGVMLGDQVSGAAWDSRLAQVEAEPDCWCLQERIDVPHELFPWVSGELAWEERNVNLNPYVLGGRYGGALTRLSTSPVINVSAGGGMVPTFIVAGRKGRV